MFIQNGMIAPLLEKHGLHKNTQALIYFAIQKVGSNPDDGGISVVTGKWGKHLASLCNSLGVQMEVVAHEAYEHKMYEKLIWNCVFGLLGEVTGDSVGEIVENKGKEVRILTKELRGVVNKHTHVFLDDELIDRMFAYSHSVSEFKGGLKEFKYRNGWFVEREKSPLHMELLSKTEQQI